MSEQSRASGSSRKSSNRSSRPSSSRPASRPGSSSGRPSSRPGSSSRNSNADRRPSRSLDSRRNDSAQSESSGSLNKTPESRTSFSRSNDRPARNSDRPTRNSDRPARSNDRGNDRGPRSGQRAQFNRDGARRPVDENRRVRKFAEPPIPEEITGKELEKKDAFALQSLAQENGEMVAKHLVALEMSLESDPEKAYWHGQSAVFRAGRVAIVREKAGIAALRFGKYEIAIKEFRAAQRISGSPSVIPYLAQCELALGDPRKTLEIAGSVDPKLLTPEQRVELRIAAAGARTKLGQHDAAVVTLTCSELTQSDQLWSKKLRTAYRDALIAADRASEARAFEEKYPQSFVD